MRELSKHIGKSCTPLHVCIAPLTGHGRRNYEPALVYMVAAHASLDLVQLIGLFLPRCAVALSFNEHSTYVNDRCRHRRSRRRHWRRRT
jgi:hypothetical protein